MKRIMISLLIFLGCVAIAVTSTTILTQKYEKLSEELDDVVLLAQSEDESLYRQNEKLLKTWEECKPTISLFINRKYAEELATSIYKMQGYLEKGDYALYLGETYSLKSSLDHILKGDNMSLEIFT